MKPTSFQTTSQRHYCLIVVSLACDDAIEAGIIAKNNVTPLLFFFIKAWKNVQIHRWLTNRNTSMLRESRLIGLISFLYEKGSVFEYDCKRSTIAHLLLESGDLNTIYPNDTFFHLYFFKSRKHSDGRQGASSFCASITTADRIFAAIGWSTPTADRVLDASGWNTLTADRVFPQFAQTS